MKLHEHQSRLLLSASGLPVPNAVVVGTPAEAAAAAAQLGRPVVVKAQVLSGGRGKAGGIRLADDPPAASAAAAEILGLSIGGHSVDRLMVAEQVEIASEFYLAALPDRARAQVMVMASAAGGVDIEQVAAEQPAAIKRVYCPAGQGLAPYAGRQLGYDLGIPGDLVSRFANIAAQTVRCLEDHDASLVEINPLVVTAQGELSAIDAKITLDDSALFRHPDLATLRNPEEETAQEAAARAAGIAYVKLDGSIGCMVNGAGLAMALLDVIVSEGGQPANFLDVGGGADAAQVRQAMEIILSDPGVKVVLVNIFGGITRCDDVARGITAALASLDRSVPLVTRLVGTNEQEGLAILRAAGISAHRGMISAVQAAIAASGA